MMLVSNFEMRSGDSDVLVRDGDMRSCCSAVLFFFSFFLCIFLSSILCFLIGTYAVRCCLESCFHCLDESCCAVRCCLVLFLLFG